MSRIGNCWFACARLHISSHLRVQTCIILVYLYWSRSAHTIARCNATVLLDLMNVGLAAKAFSDASWPHQRMRPFFVICGTHVSLRRPTVDLRQISLSRYRLPTTHAKFPDDRSFSIGCVWVAICALTTSGLRQPVTPFAECTHVLWQHYQRASHNMFTSHSFRWLAATRWGAVRKSYPRGKCIERLPTSTFVLIDYDTIRRFVNFL